MPLRKEIIARALDLSKDISYHSGQKGDLTLIQVRTLSFIASKGHVRASELSREFNVTPATITAQIDRLVNGGWLSRINSTDDRRAINIELTKKAEKELDSIVKENLKRYAWIFDDLTEKDEKCLLEILHKIYSSGQKKRA